MLGRLIVQKGLAAAEDVHDCQEFQRELLNRTDPSSPRSLADLFVNNGVITRKQLDQLRKQLADQPQSHQIPGFRIIKELGSGAMATVYLAKQLSLDRMVAIKILPRQYSENPQFVDRFHAEGRAAAKLNHANIMGALDVGKAGNYHYFVMEYVEGRTVLDDLTEHTQYNEEAALKIALQIARALEHAHQAGLIHRDVKPKNIILTHDGIAKLADMGLARMQSDREEAEAEQGKAFGTPYYISPEQIRGDLDIDFKADIYCFGATLYHMVTGRVPFDGPNPSSVMQKHLKEDPKAPDHINPALSTGIGEIIELCMAKDPNHRYTSTSSLLEDLEAVAQGNPPIVARKRFDLAVLSTLEQAQEPHGEHTNPPHEPKHRATPLYAQPIVWIAMLGWITSIMLILAIMFIA